MLETLNCNLWLRFLWQCSNLWALWSTATSIALLTGMVAQRSQCGTSRMAVLSVVFGCCSMGSSVLRSVLRDAPMSVWHGRTPPPPFPPFLRHLQGGPYQRLAPQAAAIEHPFAWHGTGACKPYRTSAKGTAISDPCWTLSRMTAPVLLCMDLPAAGAASYLASSRPASLQVLTADMSHAVQ